MKSNRKSWAADLSSSQKHCIALTNVAYAVVE